MQRHYFLVLGALAVTGGCSDAGPPARIARIDVASPVDSILTQGAHEQFTAIARDNAGQTITAVFTWQSSDTRTANVDATGFVTALVPGPTTIRVSAPADAGIEGALAIRVVDADLTTIRQITPDAYGTAVLNALSSGAKSAALASWNLCATHATTGNIVAIRRCVTELRTQADAATDGNDRALLGALGLFANEIERRLAL